jgi:hypothetical protein
MSVAQKVVGVGLTNNVTTAAYGSMATVPAPYDNVTKSARPLVNTTATITLPATVNKSWLIHSFSFSLYNATGVPATVVRDVFINDGFGDIWVGSCEIGAFNYIDRIIVSGVAIMATAGQAVTISFSVGAGINTFESVNVGAYLI